MSCDSEVQVPERIFPPDSTVGRATAERPPEASSPVGAVGPDGQMAAPDEQKARRQHRTQRELVIASLRANVDFDLPRNGQGA